jgi:hypothetical protein
VKAPPPDATPYAWAVEYPLTDPPEQRIVSFIAHVGDHDRAYAERYASRLHGQVLPLFTERRAS